MDHHAHAPAVGLLHHVRVAILVSVEQSVNVDRLASAPAV